MGKQLEEYIVNMIIILVFQSNVMQFIPRSARGVLSLSLCETENCNFTENGD